MRIDHVIYGTSDLDAASERFESAGLRVAPGGAHEGIGTHNRIVPLGADYVELLAILDAGMAAASPLGRLITERITRGDGWMGWGVAVEDAAAAADRLGASQMEVRRQGTGHLVGLPEALAEPFLPFLIQRAARTDAGGIERVEVSGDARRLAEWLGGAELPVDVVDGPPALRAVTIRGRRL
jgi:catechol 2,3-dioxygenase-like lactoylglutathione lyase family enzyme